MRDADVRNAMMQRLLHSHRDDCTTRIVQEMGIWSGTVRVDIAVINGELAGVELKSDKDTLDRLPNQATFYSRVFDRMTLVVGSKHLEKALPLVPEWWGIVAASWKEDAISLEDYRTASVNPEPDPFLVAQLLWREEAIAALEDRGAAKGWKSKRVATLHRHLAETIPIDELRAVVRTNLKARPDRSGQPVAHMGNVAV